VNKYLSRREFLRAAGISAAAGVLAACQPQVVEKMVEVTREVEVEKEVPVEVEVERTVEVEKIVEVTAEAPPQVDEPFDLVHWAEGYLYSEDERFKPYQDAVKDRFKEMYPHVTVKFENFGWDEALRQNLVTALLGGTAPDVIVGENFFQQYADLGAMAPLDDAIVDIEDNLIPGTYAAAVTQGKVYGICQFTGCFGFERNPNVIEAAGLDPSEAPTTWDELLEQAEIITEAGNGEFYGYTLQGPVGFSVGGIFRIAVYMKQAGADMCSDDCTYPWFDNPKAEEVLSFLREINRYTPPGLTFNPDEGQVYTQLFLGKSAYQICGSWHVGWAKDSGLDNAMYSGIPIPAGGQPASIVVGNVINGVLTASEHKTEAAALCKMFTEDDIQDLVNPVLGRMPSTRSALQRLEPTASDADKAFINELLTADLGVLPQWRKDPQKLWTIYNDMLTQVLSTEDPILGIMDEAQVAADAVMAA
jgi:multiple sugar transport system substrate-binding protein